MADDGGGAAYWDENEHVRRLHREREEKERKFEEKARRWERHIEQDDGEHANEYELNGGEAFDFWRTTGEGRAHAWNVVCAARRDILQQIDAYDEQIQWIKNDHEENFADRYEELLDLRVQRAHMWRMYRNVNRRRHTMLNNRRRRRRLGA